MRQKLNESQAAQVGLVAILVVVAVIFFLKASGGGEEEESTGAVATVNGSTATGETPGAAVDAAIAGLGTGAVEAEGGAVPTSIPAPPPPPAFTSAYESGRTVVLLVIHNGGIDDKLTAKAADSIEALPDVELIRVPLSQLPRYAAITVGLELNRVPALVVLEPRRVSGGVPQATVDYGFQTPQSVVQAVRDASYQGPEATYHPG